MANRGFALYKRGNDLYILSVAYEYADSKFVGFDESGDVFKINKLSDKQKEWLKNHDPKQSEKAKNYIFIGDYFLYRVAFSDFPKGKPYTQLPGGGGVYKETRKYNLIYDVFKNDTILSAIEKYGTFNEGYAIVKNLIKEEVEKIFSVECPELTITSQMKKEVDKYKTVEDLLRAGGLSIKTLDMAAFGFNEDTIKSIMPKDLNIKWKDDYNNVVWEQNKSGKNKEQWASEINLSKPIDVSFSKGKFWLEDGHHRYYAAKILKKPLKVNLEIKENPILKLAPTLGYDDFHRCIFKKVKQFKMNENSLKQEKPAVGFTAVSIEDESEKEKINKIFDSLREQGKIPESFIRPRFPNGDIDYHMTIKLGELPVGFKKDLDKEVVLNIKTVGISDSAVALGASGEYFSDNEFQHITLAFATLPENSKHIKNWQPLEQPIQVKGVIREFTSRKKLIKRGVFDEANQIQIGNFPDQTVPAGQGSSFPQEEI